MKLTWFDLAVLFLMNSIGGFVILYFLVETLVPKYQSWEFVASTIIFSICIAYIDVRLFLLMIDDDIKKRRKTQ